MVLGSVPAALLGAWSLHLLGNSKGAENHVQTILGAALLVGAAAMMLRVFLDKRRASAATPSSATSSSGPCRQSRSAWSAGSSSA